MSEGKVFSFQKLANKKFKSFDWKGMLLDTLGNCETNFSMLIWGQSNQGKSTFVLKLMKELIPHGKIYFNSIEQGEGLSLQQASERIGLMAVKATEISIGNKHSYGQMVKALEKNRATIVIIDSIDYMGLTADQYRELRGKFPNKAFIMISWEGYGRKPQTQAGKDIKYMADIKCRVDSGVAFPESRFGETKPFVILPEKAKQHPKYAELVDFEIAISND
jgi:hypothetical protein